MTRIRGEQSTVILHDPVTGRDRVLRVSFKHDVLNGAHGLDTDGGEVIYPLDCGCVSTVAGRCEVCRALSCPNCHGRCHQCKVPLCLEHSLFVPTDSGAMVRLCKGCHNNIRRTRRLIAGARVLLSPFVRWEDRHGSR